MCFPDLGDIKEWNVDAYGDAGYKSLPDKMSSCGGRAILMTYTKMKTSCQVSWRSKKLKRIVVSSTAVEMLVTKETIGEAVYVKAVLKEMQGDGVVDIPINL